MNSSNLRPPFTPSEARENGKKGAIASVKARRSKRDLRKALLAFLEGKGDDGLTGAEKLAATLVQSALDGNVRAFAEIRDTVYGKPVSTVEMSGRDGTPLTAPVFQIGFIDAAD